MRFDTVYRAIGIPTIFADGKSTCPKKYFCTEDRARRWGRRYLRRNPHGEVLIHHRLRRSAR